MRVRRRLVIIDILNIAGWLFCAKGWKFLNVANKLKILYVLYIFAKKVLLRVYRSRDHIIFPHIYSKAIPLNGECAGVHKVTPKIHNDEEHILVFNACNVCYVYIVYVWVSRLDKIMVQWARGVNKTRMKSSWIHLSFNICIMYVCVCV